MDVPAPKIWIGSLLFFVVFWVLSLSPSLLPGIAEAKLLNIGGSLSYSFSGTKSKSRSGGNRVNSYVNSYTPQFNVNVSGELPTRPLGNYHARYSWSKTNIGTCDEGNKLLVCKDVDQRSSFRIREYSGSVGLFPGWSPLSLSAQNVLRESETGTAGSVLSTKDRIETRAATWNLSIRGIPRLILVYQQAELKPDTGFDVFTRAASAMSDASIGKMEVRTGYQFSETESGDLGSETRSRVHGLNMDVFSQFAPGLTATGYVRVVKTDLP
ncbi:MAG TPA: hypothetical protein VLB09_08140, partial [Nitrospiria bacterium]|nr:hypothetical protein [Nitrospiria bacterium]